MINLLNVMREGVRPSRRAAGLAGGSVGLAIALIDTVWAIELRAAAALRRAVEAIDLAGHVAGDGQGRPLHDDGEDVPGLRTRSPQRVARIL